MYKMRTIQYGSYLEQLFTAKPPPCITTCILILIITFVIPVVIPCCNYLVVIYFCVGISVKYIAGKASAVALCISYIIMLHSICCTCFHPEINTTVMVFYYGEKNPTQFSMTLHILTKMKLQCIFGKRG